MAYFPSVSHPKFCETCQVITPHQCYFDYARGICEVCHYDAPSPSGLPMSNETPERVTKPCFRCGKPVSIGKLGMLMRPDGSRPHDCNEDWMTEHGYDSAARSSGEAAPAEIEWLRSRVERAASLWRRVQRMIIVDSECPHENGFGERCILHAYHAEEHSAAAPKNPCVVFGCECPECASPSGSPTAGGEEPSAELFARLDALVEANDWDLGAVTFNASEHEGMRIVNVYLGESPLPVGCGSTAREALECAIASLEDAKPEPRGLRQVRTNGPASSSGSPASPLSETERVHLAQIAAAYELAAKYNRVRIVENWSNVPTLGISLMVAFCAVAPRYGLRLEGIEEDANEYSDFWQQVAKEMILAASPALPRDDPRDDTKG